MSSKKRPHRAAGESGGSNLPGSPAEPAFSFMKLRHVRCFEDANVSFDPRVTVIIGENGAGKTTIAEALASLAFGDGEGLRNFPFRRGCRDGAIELYQTGSDAPAAWWTAGKKAERMRLPAHRYLFSGAPSPWPINPGPGSHIAPHPTPEIPELFSLQSGEARQVAGKRRVCAAGRGGSCEAVSL